jgi:hypothetical protein
MGYYIECMDSGNENPTIPRIVSLGILYGSNAEKILFVVIK